MEGLTAVWIGLGLLGGGAAAWLAARLFIARADHRPAIAEETPVDPEPAMDAMDGLAPHNDCVLRIAGGGKLESINLAGQQLFKTGGSEQVSLERIARRVRPPETFLHLCAVEGRADLVVENQALEGNSFRVSSANGGGMVVTLRAPGQSQRRGKSSRAGRAIDSDVYEYNQRVRNSLDRGQIFRETVAILDHLIPADVLEVTLYDEGIHRLVPYRCQGVPGSGRAFAEIGQTYKPDVGLSGKVFQRREPILASVLQEQPELQPAVDMRTLPLRSYSGAPLMVGDDCIGTIEMGSYLPGQFQGSDLEMLAAIAAPLSAALENSRRYEREKQRADELSGIIELTQAFRDVRDPQTLFANLVNAIAPLLDTEIIGFFLVNEAQRTLESQAPFQGLPDQVLELYNVSVSSGSPLEAALVDQKVLASENAFEDPAWLELGLENLARGASLRETVLTPISSGGRLIGYLQVANHRDRARAFSEGEIDLLRIIANQAGPVIENANLVIQSRQRAMRAEGLRRIASLTGSGASADEILKFAIQELAHLVQAEQAAVLLLDQGRSTLGLHRDSLYGNRARLKSHVTHLPVEDAQFPFTVTGTQHVLQYNRFQAGEKPLVPFYQELMIQWNLDAVLVVPLLVRDEGIGEIWLGWRSSRTFDQADIQVAFTAAGQLAGVIDQASRSDQTDELLWQRVDQLTGLVRFSRELAALHETGAILDLVHQEAVRISSADCGTVMLLLPTESKEMAFTIDRHTGCNPTAAISAVELHALQNREVLVVDDVTTEGIETNHAEGSLLMIPVIYQGVVNAVIQLHSKRIGFFSASPTDVLLSLAGQTSVALANTLQLKEHDRQSQVLKRELDTLGELLDLLKRLQPERPLQERLELVANAITKATPFRMALISVHDPATGELMRLSRAGIPEDAWRQLSTRSQAWSAVAQLLKEDFKTGSSYFIPADRLPVVPPDVHTVTILGQTGSGGAFEWQPEDMLLIPMEDAQGGVLGLISLDDPADGKRPDHLTFDALELFSRQAAALIQINRRQAETDAEIASLLSQTGVIEQIQAQAADQTAVLLRKDLDQTLAIQSLNAQIERADAGMALAEQIGGHTEPMQVLRLVAQEMIDRYRLNSVLIAEQTPEGGRLLQVLGEAPKRANPEALFGQANPLRQSLVDDEIILIDQLKEGDPWYGNPLVAAFKGKSLVALPFHPGEGRNMALVGIGQSPIGPFDSREMLELRRMVRQVEEVLEKLHLLAFTHRRLDELNLLLDFSRRLGSLDEADILGALVETIQHAILPAQACWAGKPVASFTQLQPIAAVGYVDPESLFSLRLGLSEADAKKRSLPVRVLESGAEELIKEISFTREYPLLAEDLLKLRRATGGRLPIASMVLPITRGEDRLGVVVAESFSTEEAFTPEDLMLAQSLARQTALALENSRLFADTQQRTAQLQALTEVSTTITSSLMRDELIQSLLDQLRTVIPCETATLWLRDNRQLVVAAAKGFDDGDSRVGLTVSVEDSRLFQQMVESGQPIVVADITNDDRFPTLLEPKHYAWMGIPLIAKSQLVGAIALEKHEAGYYNLDHVQAAATFAGQAAVALENARLFELSQERAAELDERSRRLAFLNQYSAELGSSLEVNFIFKMTVKYLMEALPIDRTAVVMLDEKRQPAIVHEAPATNERLPLELPALPWFNTLAESGGVFSCERLINEDSLGPLQDAYFSDRKVQSLLVLPLIAGSEVIGWVWLQNKDLMRFDMSQSDLARTIVNQSAIAIQNARLLQETINLTQDLEARVISRTEELQREHENTQTLLRIITELTSSLDLNQVLNRTLNVLNDAVGSEMSMILMAGLEEVYQTGRLAHLRWSGNPASVEAEIARWVIANRMGAISSEITLDDRWKPRSAQTIIYRSAIGVPLVLGEEVLGALMMFHRKNDAFRQSQVNLVEAAARQISIALNNAELFKLIREQAENLGNMLREQQIETSRSRAILEAVADGVMVTDDEKRITLLNPSASRILALSTGSAIDHSLDEFSGIFGGEAGALMRTIEEWTANPAASQPDSNLSQQIELEDGRVLAISLAPVSWRSQFLGTVSIFRDITQEVQVDRLKSEFVANVSHELRTPMTSIKGYVEVILMGAAGPINAQQEQFLGIVKSNTERLTELVNDLLDISRIEAGRVVLTLQPLDLVEIAGDIRSDILRRCAEENKPISVEIVAPKRLPMILGDAERVRQVLANLVSNGYNYSDPGGRIAVRMQADGDQVEVAVTDNGIGIKPEDQARIFERFFRGDDPLVLASSGTGLGLAISRTLVEMHQGKIWFESSGVRGEGSTFHFTLPIYRKGEE